MTKHKKTSLLSKIGKFLMDIEDVQRTDVTDSGENVRIYQLYDGKEVMVDEDGLQLLIMNKHQAENTNFMTVIH